MESINPSKHDNLFYQSIPTNVVIAPECPAPPTVDELQKQIAELTALVKQLAKQ
jgi:hypothetical protein